MKQINWSQLRPRERADALRRPAVTSAGDLPQKTQAIVERVRAEGDGALRDFTRRFDGVELADFRVSEAEIDRAFERVAREDIAALERAAGRIERFHRAELPRALSVEVSPGVRCERIPRPIGSVGLYAPGGSAVLPSTVLMLGVPSKLAGCPVRFLCSPPQRGSEGSLEPSLLVAARLCGIRDLFKVGGAQAIAAMAYGTESIPKADKIFGPGNAWVTEAKSLVSRDPLGAAIDMPAGPSEVLVIADESANAAFVAADLLSQAEHGADSQVLLVTDSPLLAERVRHEVAAQLARLPRREIATQSLATSLVILVNDLAQAFEVSNAYAPEHLILQTREPRQWLPAVRAAGSVFLGAWSPEAVGDYASGTNHVLPTYGAARAVSGVGVESFMTQITVQELTPEGLRDIGPTVERLATLEGLDAHKQAVTLRLAALAREAFPAAPATVPLPAVLNQALREDIRRLEAYSSARSLATEGRVFLDANESPRFAFDPEPEGLNRYPEPQPRALRERLAGIYGVRPENLMIGRGVDEAIDVLVRTFCEAGRDSILIHPPTYGVYAIAAQTQGAAVAEVPLGPAPDFAVDFAGLAARVDATTKIIFICNPNNPTGGASDPEQIFALARRLADRCIVAVDEAYIEFARGTRSLAPEATRLPNLLVLRTLSKAWALAGARCGVAIATPELISLLQKVRAPYPLAAPAVTRVLEGIDETAAARTQARVQAVLGERAKLSRELSALNGVEAVYPSEANFLVARVRGARELTAFLKQRGLLVRDRSSEAALASCVRFSIGNETENTALLEGLRAFFTQPRSEGASR